MKYNVINKPLTCQFCKEKKPRKSFRVYENGKVEQKCSDCKKISYNKGSVRTKRTCRCCNELKCSKTQYELNKYKCNSCMEKRPMKRKFGAKKSDTQRCRKCGKQVKKTNFEVKESGRLSYACNRCRTSKSPTLKKTKEVEKHRVGSYEESHTMKLTAHEALAKAKQREADLMSGGARYVKGNGVRMYVLSK